MCVFWIYVLAKELVLCLSAVGVILGVPPSILGLTVLAWGNSIGDLSSNVAVASKGYGEMAIAGCYAGPVFELLVGLGISYFIVTMRADTFPINLDPSSWVSIAFCYVSLLSTLYFVTSRGNVFEKKLGFYLLFLYFVYTMTQLFLLLYEVVFF
jgi:sodium/potassium/calcium exchanger 6